MNPFQKANRWWYLMFFVLGQLVIIATPAPPPEYRHSEQGTDLPQAPAGPRIDPCTNCMRGDDGARAAVA